MKQGTKGHQSSFCFSGGPLSLFTEQGSSASQMTAAKVMDIISRLTGCAGQAADAVSAETQVPMEDAPKLLKIPKSEWPRTLRSTLTAAGIRPSAPPHAKVHRVSVTVGSCICGEPSAFHSQWSETAGVCTCETLCCTTPHLSFSIRSENFFGRR